MYVGFAHKMDSASLPPDGPHQNYGPANRHSNENGGVISLVVGGYPRLGHHIDDDDARPKEYPPNPKREHMASLSGILAMARLVLQATPLKLLGPPTCTISAPRWMFG